MNHAFILPSHYKLNLRITESVGYGKRLFIEVFQLIQLEPQQHHLATLINALGQWSGAASNITKKRHMATFSCFQHPLQHLCETCLQKKKFECDRPLEERSQTFCKGPGSRCLWLYWPYSLCCNWATLFDSLSELSAITAQTPEFADPCSRSNYELREVQKTEELVKLHHVNAVSKI